MMNENGLKTPSEHEEAEMLLPWYVTGRISDADRERVERYLTDHPKARDQLALVREEIAETDTLNTGLGTPRAGALGKLMAQIEDADGPAIARAQAPSLSERLTAWLPSFESPALQFAGIAAAVVIVAQGVVIGALVVGSDQSSQYETASGTPQSVAQPGTRLLVAFSGEATAQSITTLLKETGATIVSGPKGAGIFEIRIAEKALSDAEIERAIADFKARAGIVRFVARTQ